MPAPTSPPAGGSGARYVAPKYGAEAKRGTFRFALVTGLIVLLVAAGVVVFMTWTPPRNDTVNQALDKRAAELAAAQEQDEKDAVRGGWVGVLDLPLERATITIATVADDAALARRFASDVEKPVALATITIDNSNGAADLTVNTTGATLEFSDGTKQQSLSVVDVLPTVRKDRETRQKQLIQPYTCRAGQRAIGKLLLMPAGVDPNKLTRISLYVNGQPQQVAGTFMDEAEKSRMVRTGQFKLGGS
jgi:hypothetical protein